MNLTITDEALNYMKQRLDGATSYLLAADDGSNDYSIGKGGACSVGDSFQVVGVKELKPEYNVKLENNQGVDFYTSDNDKKFFGDGLKIDFKNNFLNLKDNSEILDGQMVSNNQAK